VAGHLLENDAIIGMRDDAAMALGKAAEPPLRHIVVTEQPSDLTASECQALRSAQAIQVNL
jgi:hypothetical protein